MPQPHKQKKHILVVDDDPAFAHALKISIEMEHLEATIASNGKAAQSLITTENYDLVISDIRMPEVNGIELLHFIKSTKPIPVVLMTGFTDLAETKEAYSLGADDFLPKPFKRDELLRIIKKHCNAPGATSTPIDEWMVDGDFCRISIEDFVAGKDIPYEIYIRLSSNRYIKISHSGEDLAMERIRAYKSKEIFYLYLKKEDFKKYLGLNLLLTNAIKKTNLVNKTKKLNFLKHTGEVILENLYVNDLDKEGFEGAKNVVETTVSLVSDEKDIFDILNILNNHADFLYAHSLGVSLYAVMIARELQWFSQNIQFKLSMGGLFHDIGKKEIDRSILEKSRKDLDSDELALYESHPIRGMQILTQMKSIPSDVIQIVMQHHENCAGFGFPTGIKKNKIHPLSRVVSVANEFCDVVIKNPSQPNPLLSPKDAVTQLVNLKSSLLDTDILIALANVFKVTTAFKKQSKGGKYAPHKA